MSDSEDDKNTKYYEQISKYTQKRTGKTVEHHHYKRYQSKKKVLIDECIEHINNKDLDMNNYSDTTIRHSLNKLIKDDNDWDDYKKDIILKLLQK